MFLKHFLHYFSKLKFIFLTLLSRKQPNKTELNFIKISMFLSLNVFTIMVYFSAVKKIFFDKIKFTASETKKKLFKFSPKSALH